MHISEAVLKAVSELDLRSRRNVAALLAGNYRSAFRGSGMQFKEFRHYEAGDDIRHMSWAVTARTGRATIKLYEEERELDVIVLVDVSGSSLFGITPKRKVDMYSELLALIGLAAVKSGDNVGMLLFDDKPSSFLPPRKTRDHVLVALTTLLGQQMNQRHSDLRAALRYLQGVLHNRTLVVVMSDFMVPSFQNEVRMLSKKHEIILLHCYDDAEKGEKLDGVYEVCDPETGQFYLLDGNSKRTRNVLREYQLNLRKMLRDCCHGVRADYLSLSVEDDYLATLVRFFKRRGPARI